MRCSIRKKETIYSTSIIALQEVKPYVDATMEYFNKERERGEAMTTEQKLNEKIAKWLGWEHEFNYWYEYDKDNYKRRRPIPCFCSSLDMCFKYIAPKLAEKGIVITVGSFEHSGYYAVAYYFDKSEPELIGDDKSASMALCRAVEKVIDGER